MNNRKELTKFRAINWHDCSDSGVLQLRNNTLLTGPTGSGKSSLQDALYLVLTLNEHNFNKASGDNSKRDIRSYHRCRIDEKIDGRTQKYKRKNRVISYLLVQIEDDDQETIDVLGICFTSNSDGDDIDKRYFIISDVDLEDVELIDENRRPREFKDLANNFQIGQMEQLRNKSAAKERFCEVVGFKKDQIDLYEKWGRILAKVMSGKDAIPNVDFFIKENILHSHTLDIDEMESKLKTLTELQNQLEEYKTRSDVLIEIHDKMKQIHEIYDTIKENDVLYVVANYEHLTAELEKYEKQLKELETENTLCLEEIEALNSKRDQLKEKIFRLESMDDKQQLAEFNKEKKQLEIRLENCNSVKRSLCLAITSFNDLIVANNVVKSVFTTDLNMNQEDVGVEQLNALLGELERLQDVLVNKSSEFNTMKNTLTTEIGELKKETEQMKNGMSASHPATAAVNAINKYFEKAYIGDEAKVICDYIDFNTSDAQWKETLEAYLGPTRFFIVVKPENYQKAKEIVQNGDFYNISIIDTTKDYDVNVKDNSICNLFTYKNYYVEQFLKYRYGTIIAVETCLGGLYDLKGKYLGRDGSKYGGHLFTSKAKKVQYYIGQDAKATLIKENEAELNKKTVELSNITKNINAAEDAKKAIKTMINRLSTYDHKIFHDLKTLPGEIQVLEDNIYQLTSDEAMYDAQKQLNDLKNSVLEIENQTKTLNKKQNDISKKQGAAEDKEAEARTKLEEIKDQYENYRINDAEAVTKAEEEYKDILSDTRKSVASVSRALEKDRQKLENKAEEMNRSLSNMQRSYCDLYNNILSFEGMASEAEFDEEYQRIAINGVTELSEAVEVSRADELNAIKTNMMLNFKRNFDNGRQIIKNLNKTLKDVSYGGKNYLLTTPTPAPGFEKWYQLIEDTVVPGFSGDPDVFHTDEEYEDFYHQVRTNPDFQDYRNYLKCDVSMKQTKNGQIIEKRLSESLAVSSGGEKQVPLYILSAMALLSIYVADRTNNVLHFAIMDEAFSFVDGAHTQGVLGYFKEIDLQLLIGVPDRMAKTFVDFCENSLWVSNTAKGRTFKALESARKVPEITINSDCE